MKSKGAARVVDGLRAAGEGRSGGTTKEGVSKQVKEEPAPAGHNNTRMTFHSAREDRCNETASLTAKLFSVRH